MQATVCESSFPQAGELTDGSPEALRNAALTSTVDGFAWQQQHVGSAAGLLGFDQQWSAPKKKLRQVGLREPSGQRHSKWGDVANSVVHAVNQIVVADNRFRRRNLIPSVYPGRVPA